MNAAKDPLVAEWIQAHAIPIRTLDPNDDDFSDLEPLRKIVGNARLVSIGESDHFVHEFFQLRHRMLQFLVSEMGFSAYVMESGFPEGLRVNEWLHGGPGEIEDLLRSGITFSFGRSQEGREQLARMRAWNDSNDHKVSFYGMDLPASLAHPKPALDAALAFLDVADPEFAMSHREALTPILDRVTGRFVAEALPTYLALEPGIRRELTALIAELTSRLQAGRVVYAERSSAEAAELAYRCAISARQMDGWMASRSARPSPSEGVAPNLRDAAMAENVMWILEREKRIVMVAHNLHVQGRPMELPHTKQTTLGEFLAVSLGNDMVIIGTTYGSGELIRFHSLGQEIPGAKSTWQHGEVRASVIDAPAPDPKTMDALLGQAELPHFLLDLSRIPSEGPIAERFHEVTAMTSGSSPADVDPLKAFDALVYVDHIRPNEVSF